MKILVTGGSGLLGQYLNIELAKNHDLFTLYKSRPGNCKSFDSAKLDITEYHLLEKIFEEFNPDVVVHSAAVSKSNTADELPPKLVYEINVNATKKLAEFCDQYNSKLIYISTDLVYAGYRGSNLDEKSKLVPISIYAETKLMGEVKIKETFENYLILRMALLYGSGLNHSSCHFQFMYNRLKNGNSVNLFYDQFRSPIELSDAARLINDILEVELKNKIINFGGPERLSRFDLGEILCEITGFDKKLLKKVSMNELDIKYKVADVSMDINMMNSIGLNPLKADESIRKITPLWDI